MTCIKTGCHAHIAPYDEYAYGDAYRVGGVLILRLVQREFFPILRFLHFRVFDIGDWWDKEHTVSTLVTDHFVNLGYEGLLVSKEERAKCPKGY